MAPVVDFSDVEVTEFGALPNGTYRMACDRVPEIRTSQNGNENVLFVLKVSDVIRTRGFDGDGDGLMNRTVPHGCALTAKSLWNFQRTAIALGADPSDFESELDIDDAYLEQFEDKECVVTLGTRTYEGQDQNDVRNIRALTEEEAAALA